MHNDYFVFWQIGVIHNKLRDEKGIQMSVDERITTILVDTCAFRDANSDFIGIGKYLYQNNYKYYKKNKDKLEDKIKDIKAEYDINITYTQKTSIKRGDEKY